MHAWTKAGHPSEHPEPWGRMGAFTTLHVLPGKNFLFLEEHLKRLRFSASHLELPWIPSEKEIIEKLDEVFVDHSEGTHLLLRICLFEDLLGFAVRPNYSDANPVEGWLLSYRRPNPAIKCTVEKELYGTLSELEITREDWVILDPKDNDLRETATSNLIFAQGDELLIPEKRILNGITLQQLLPILATEFRIIRGTPQDQDIFEFEEILLCGTGRGIATLTKLSELGWSNRSNECYQKVRFLYEKLINSAGV